MKTYTYTLAGEACTIHFPERDEDLAGFDRFLAQGDKVLGFDTETTNLDIYTPGHKVRLAQFGNRTEAWVLRCDLFGGAVARALSSGRYFTAHNAPFDLLVVDRHLGVKVESLGPRCFDTRIMAHLIDPRGKHEGGTGLGLKDLSEIHVDDTAPDTAAGLYETFRTEYKATKDTGWAVIDIDHPTYVLYAGLDALLARRLFDELRVIIKGTGQSALSTFEHHLAVLLAMMQRKGMKVDVPYTEGLRDELRATAAEFEKVAARYGVTNINSTTQVASALVAMGETLTETTKTGWKVDKEVLMPLADLDRDWKPIGARKGNPLADAILRAKRADKWAGSYAQAFLDLRDSDDRLHPMIGGLAARTARMSISRPPLQQLPSSDWRIRRALIADPGHKVISSDYDQIELRVLAGLADERAMKKAINDGVDLHDFTASIIYGEGFTKAQRKLSKGVAFGKVYGGGATTLSRQTGAPIEQVKHAIAGYDNAFPGVSRFGKRLQARAQYGKREVVTYTGRHLPLDRDRLYAATNYVCQSLARDMLAQAIVDLHEEGLGDYLLLPVHDEIVAQAPDEDAEAIAQLIGVTMTRQFEGVPITSTGEVTGRSWGSAYGCPAELDAAA